MALVKIRIWQVILDFATAETPINFQTDVCIIGAGAAGITLARKYIGSVTKVLVLESGGKEFEEDTQELYAGESVGLPYELDTSRLRFLGGTTNHWEGVCGPLEELDFKRRSWVPHSGWPFSKAELDPFYQEAQSVCQVGPNIYGDDVWDYIERKPLKFDPKKLQYGFRQMGEFPVRFGEYYYDEISSANNIQLLLHANVINIQLHPDALRVNHVDIRNLHGKEGKVSARYFVLACGAIENARILLISNTVVSGGVGNQHDLVGRFFQEHPVFGIGELFAGDEEAIVESFLQEFVGGIRFVQHLKTSLDVQTRERTLNSMIYLYEVLKPDTGMAAARDIYGAIRKGQSVDDFGEKIWRVLGDLDDVALNAYRRFVLGKGTRPPIERVELHVATEQAPNANSRVTLSTEKDGLGLNRTRLNWVMTEMERRTALSTARILASEFGRLGLGRVKLSDEVLQDDRMPDVRIGSHHMGTTRMSDSPQNGVVDSDCRVHGLSNLYVAGSSVFPTGGFMNPTLTIVALALRLFERLKLNGL